MRAAGRAALVLVLGVILIVSLFVPRVASSPPVDSSRGVPFHSPREMARGASLPNNPANCSQGTNSIFLAPLPDADNRPALLKAYDTLGSEGGGTIYLSAGTFYLYTALDPDNYSNVSIQGAGPGTTVLSLPPSPVGLFAADNGTTVGRNNSSSVNFIEVGKIGSPINNFRMCDLSLDAQATSINETWYGSLIYDQSGGSHHVYSDISEDGFFGPWNEPDGLHILSFNASKPSTFAVGYVIENFEAVNYSYPDVPYPNSTSGFNFLNVGDVYNCTVDNVTGVGLLEFDNHPDPGCVFENLRVKGAMLIDPKVGGSWQGAVIENSTVTVNGTDANNALRTSVANKHGIYYSNMTGLRFDNDTFYGTVGDGHNMVDVENSTFWGGLNSTPAVFLNNRVVWVDDNGTRLHLPIAVDGSTTNGSQARLEGDTFEFPNGTYVYPGNSTLEDPFQLEVPVQTWSHDSLVIGGATTGYLFSAPNITLAANSSFIDDAYTSRGAGAPDNLTLLDASASPGFVDTGAVVSGLTNIEDNLPPSPPTGLAARSATPTSIALNWTAPAGPIDNYTIQVGLAADNLSYEWNSTGGNATSYTVGGLAQHTTFYFEVWAWTAVGESPSPSGLAQATTGVSLAAPTGLTGLAISSSAIHWSWTQAVGGAIVNNTLSLFPGISCSGTATLFSTGVAATNWTTSGLTVATNYSAEVSAWNASGQGPQSECASAATLGPPPAPTNLAGFAESSSAIEWTWTQSVGGGILNDTLYIYSGAVCSDSPLSSNSTGGQATSFTLGGLALGTTYSARVTSWNASGQSPPSSCVAATTQNVPPPPTRLTGFTPGPREVEWTWTQSTGGGILNNTVYSYLGPSCATPLYVNSTSGPATSLVLRALAVDTVYSARVTSWNASGESPPSSCAVATTESVPPAPTGLTGSDAGPGLVNWTWTQSTGGGIVNNSLYLYRGPSCVEFIATYSTGGPATYLNTGGLGTGTSYSAEVTSWNATGESPPSSCALVSTQNVPPPPSGLAGVALGPREIEWTWTQSTGGGILNDTVYLYTGPDCSTIFERNSTGGPRTSFAMGGLAVGIAYSAQVTSWNSSGQSPPSVCAMASTENVPPAPTDLAGFAPGPREIEWSWTQSAGGGILNDTLYLYTGPDCSTLFWVNSTGGPATSFALAGLAVGTTYSAQVASWNSSGQSLPSVCAMASTQNVPPAPTNLTGATGVREIEWTWTQSVGGPILNNTVYFYAGGGCATPLYANSTDGPATSFALSGLAVGTVYSARVTSWNASGESPPSACVAASTDNVPPAPTGLTGAAGAQEIEWTWAQSTGGGILNNTLYLYSGSGCAGPVSVLSTGGPATGWSTGGLSLGTWYSAQVTSWNASGESARSGCAPARTTNVPYAPTGLSGSATGNTSIEWSWSPSPGGGILNYTLYLYAGSLCSTFIRGYSTGGAVTSISIDKLTPGEAYSARVTAWNVTGESALSACSAAKTLNVPPAPTGLAVVSVGFTWIQWRWTDSAGGGIVNETFYLYRGTSCSGLLSAFSVSGDSSFYTTYGLTAGTDYSADVSSWNSIGESPPSSCVTTVTVSTHSASLWPTATLGFYLALLAAIAAVVVIATVVVVIRRSRAGRPPP